MADREGCRGLGGPRPGGRSARVQASVHRAARALLARMDRAEVTIPLIAQEAGVTPSTIYRRWGELNELLADVAVERLRPDMVPVETGSGRGDLLAWAEQYAEEMSSGLGREMIRDVLAAEGADGPRRCCGYARQQIDLIAGRAEARGEAFPDIDKVLDRVIAPILFRILFDEALATEQVAGLVDCAFAAVERRAA
ncbi:TetR/AcrR family transcriptional regulator [Methylobacterium nonmethylotrophicum]|uniref:TetR/AcrR family transcriptional regulator n=1 Tax=Methylobacterium nonmethylotrophicum TaxID=1141884 RepID=A0A4Z0NQ46_9HYPH|nr:TetR/AcrR family transcriptional regulator [Methylobacterium nonmethylotrophicum]TGD98301.1 TetR/AcrR family transcriptional regulator [Methylobacterium nonmethylotrophicum]